ETKHAVEQHSAERRRRERAVRDGPVIAHELVVLEIVGDAQHGAARQTDGIREPAAAELDVVRLARVRHEGALVLIAELVARRARMYLRKILREDAERELNLLPLLDALACRLRAVDDAAQADERDCRDDPEDRDRDHELDQREAAGTAWSRGESPAAIALRSPRHQPRSPLNGSGPKPLGRPAFCCGGSTNPVKRRTISSGSSARMT